MEELEQELNTNTNIGVEAQTSSNIQTNSQLEDLPRLEDLLKSEKEVKVEQTIEGLEKVEPTTQEEDKTFSRKEDEKKVYIKKRVKILTAVYVAVATLLLTFTGINIATLVGMGNTHDNNRETIIENASDIENAEKYYQATTPTGEEIKVTLNEPRDYSDDTKELTFFDKISILFRNIF